MSAQQQACRAVFTCLARQACALQQQPGCRWTHMTPIAALYRQYAVMPGEQTAYEAVVLRVAAYPVYVLHAGYNDVA